MTRHGTPEGTPSTDEVEQDFTVPGDADLRPADDDGGSELAREDA